MNWFRLRLVATGRRHRAADDQEMVLMRCQMIADGPAVGEIEAAVNALVASFLME